MEATPLPEQPKIEDRPARPYVAVAETVSMQQLPAAVDRGFPEVFGWLQANRLQPAGAPFIRYVHVDMPSELSIELGVPIDGEAPVDERVQQGLLPAGRYAVLVHIGPYDGLVGANAALQQWARARDIVWAMDDGGRWRARVENYLTDPSQEPDASKWQTELAYLIADN
jgi:effector-binding domain-containing protein